MWLQREIRLDPRPRGFHLVTREVASALPELAELRVGLLHLHILHTSASLTLNENASPDVRRDFASWFDRAVPERAPYWTHTLEGDDDMPAHVKVVLLGPSLTLPIAAGRLALGTWQGIYLCEHRDAAAHGGSSRPPSASNAQANSVRSGSRSPRSTARSTSTHTIPRLSASTRACGLIAWAASTPRQLAIAGSMRIRSR